MDRPNCEICEQMWVEDNDCLETELANIENIEESKRCVACFEEWGDSWPDQVD